MTRRSAATRAIDAADALDAYLRTRPAGPPAAALPNTDAAVDTEANVPVPPPDAPAASSRVVARRLCDTSADRMVVGGQAGAGLAGAGQTDWLFHYLVVTGPASDVVALRAAAAGAGTVPWQLDLDLLEEDWLHRLLAPAGRTLSLAGARILAGQLRAAVERRHALASTRVGRSRSCPFDLHALRPVPNAVLELGPDHPHALAWLWQHWGTFLPVRHAAEDVAGAVPRRTGLEPGQDVWQLSFWSADWTPWPVFVALQCAWPALRFDVRPVYDSA